MTTTMNRAVLLIAALAITPAAVAGQDLQPVQPEDYGQWESLGFGGALSPTGEWLAVPIGRVNDEDELRIHHTSTDSVVVVPFATRPSFSADGDRVAFSVGKSEAERERLGNDNAASRTDLGILDLRSGELRTVTEVQSFGWGDRGRYIAMARYPNDGTRVLVVEELATGNRVSFGSVADWEWQEEGALLAFTVHGEEGEGNALQLYDAATGRVRSLVSGEGQYSGLSWREDSSDLAVLHSFEDDGREEDGHHIRAWRDLAGSGSEYSLAQADADVVGEDERVSDVRAPVWADDGESIFFGIQDWTAKDSEDSDSDGSADEEEAPDEEADDEEPTGYDALDLDDAGMEIWRASDERTLPTQKRDANRDERRSALAVWHLDAGRTVRLAEADVDGAQITAGGELVLVTDNDPYAFQAMFGRGRVDLWAVDPEDGSSVMAAEDVTFPYTASASGRHIAYFRGGDWWAFDREAGSALRLTEGAATNFTNEQYDHPLEELPSFGMSGWTERDEGLVVYDEFDVWHLPLDGAPERLTDGRSDEIIHRVVRVDPDQDGVDPRNAVISMRGKWTYNYGYGRTDGDSFRQVIYQDDNVGRLTKASDADRYAYVVQDFDDSPDYFVGSLDDLDDARQVTETNPFHSDYAWGHTELVRYTNHNGVPLQGALFYPANYDPNQTYPMIVYVYEFRSQSAKQYSTPSHRNYYNPSVWTAEGYFVLQPDILFDARDPGVSSAKTLERAVAAVVERGEVDPERVGLVGHSWGGYQAQFVPTYTDVFAASVSGAGIANLVTMYGSIFWVAGAPETGHFETGQERMEVPYYVDPDAFLRNSAVFNVESLNTPLLLEVGDDDQNVDWRQSIELYNVARRAEKPVTMLVYYGEDHGLRQEENQADYQRRILEFFDHHLRGAEPARWIAEEIPWLEQRKQNGGF